MTFLAFPELAEIQVLDISGNDGSWSPLYSLVVWFLLSTRFVIEYNVNASMPNRSWLDCSRLRLIGTREISLRWQLKAIVPNNRINLLLVLWGTEILLGSILATINGVILSGVYSTDLKPFLFHFLKWLFLKVRLRNELRLRFRLV